MKKIITIKGMHCPGCRALIEDVASEIPGIISCTVNEKTGQAVVDYDERLDWELFRNELAKVGPYQIIE